MLTIANFEVTDADNRELVNNIYEKFLKDHILDFCDYCPETNVVTIDYKKIHPVIDAYLSGAADMYKIMIDKMSDEGIFEGFDPVTDVPGVAEFMYKVAEETDDKKLQFNILNCIIDHAAIIEGKDVKKFWEDNELGKQNG